MSGLFDYTPDVYDVTRLNREARMLLEDGLATVWLQAELSNLVCPSSGHMYFSLKDANSQVRCTMFKNKNRLLAFKPINGMDVLVRAQVSLYEVRGDFQLLAEHMEQAGEGELHRAYEALKKKLSQQGLFDSVHKKTLPQMPKTIGVLTSPSGAAVKDILSTLARRYPLANIVVYPVSVQGESAATQVVSMLEIAIERGECDVLIIARGGGSLEDMSAFNSEQVAQAVFSCPLPVVSGIGHEIDFTIADFVADARAATPTAAAELVSPDQYHVKQSIQQLYLRLIQIVQTKLATLMDKIAYLQRCLPHPLTRLQHDLQRLDDLSERLQFAMRSLLNEKCSRLEVQALAASRCHPRQKLQLYEQQLEQLYQRLQHARGSLWQHLAARLANLSARLDSLSPLATLSRGYAIVEKNEGVVVHKVAQLSVNDNVLTRFAEGSARCTVNELLSDSKQDQ